FPDERATLVWGAAAALIYVAPAIGGWIGDQVLGTRRTMLLGAVAAAGAACSSKWREHESQISAGMSEAEVLELLGEPSSKVKVPAWGEQAGYVRWQWNDNLSTLATGAMFPDTVPDRVLAVSFDAEGKVTEVVLPRPTGP
ncbi:MAG: hypothetical protein ACO4CI_04735, partial [Phycisphaerales bacterium]